MSQTLLILLLVCAGGGTRLTRASNIDGPLKASANPHYFQTADGRAVILNGSQPWNTIQDWGQDRATEQLNFGVLVQFLTAHGHNFTLLWTEMPRLCGLRTTASAPPDFVVSPLPLMKTRPGSAGDGGLKFDLKINLHERLCGIRNGAVEEVLRLES